MAFSLAQRFNVPPGARIGPFIIDQNNGTIITFNAEWGDISDNKEIIWTRFPVPGQNFEPVTPNRSANTVLGASFTLIDRFDARGIQDKWIKLENLRNQILKLTDVGPAEFIRSARGRQFREYPEVIFYRGTPYPPLDYTVRSLNFNYINSELRPNNNGFCVYARGDIELELNQNTKKYRMWELFKLTSSLLANRGAARELIQTPQGQRRLRI